MGSKPVMHRFIPAVDFNTAEGFIEPLIILLCLLRGQTVRYVQPRERGRAVNTALNAVLQALPAYLL